MLSRWTDAKGPKLSQRVMDRVKPGPPLKHRIDEAQNKLGGQIAKLDALYDKFYRQEQEIFRRIVEAKKSNDDSHARIYAAELAEMRKRNNIVKNAKISMEQLRMRLNTMSDFGDVVVTLSPCMSIIRGLSQSVGAMMPEVNASMQELSSTIGDVLAGSESASLGPPPGLQAGSEATSILAEAHALIEGQAKDSLPAPPADIRRDILNRRQQYV